MMYPGTVLCPLKIHAHNNPTKGLLFHPHFTGGEVEAKEWQ